MDKWTGGLGLGWIHTTVVSASGGESTELWRDRCPASPRLTFSDGRSSALGVGHSGGDEDGLAPPGLGPGRQLSAPMRGSLHERRPCLRLPQDESWYHNWERSHGYGQRAAFLTSDSLFSADLDSLGGTAAGLAAVAAAVGEGERKKRKEDRELHRCVCVDVRLLELSSFEIEKSKCQSCWKCWMLGGLQKELRGGIYAEVAVNECGW